MSITLIWAETENGIIGKDGTMPWKLPNELKHFKEVTLGNWVVMGRKTFESMGCKPLPDRTNVVLTRDKTFKDKIGFQYDLVMVFDEEGAKEAVLGIAKTREVFIIGGSEIYEMFLEHADSIIKTIILDGGVIEGDTYAPVLEDYWNSDANKEKSRLIESDEKNKYDCMVLTYK